LSIENIANNVLKNYVCFICTYKCLKYYSVVISSDHYQHDTIYVIWQYFIVLPTLWNWRVTDSHSLPT